MQQSNLRGLRLRFLVASQMPGCPLRSSTNPGDAGSATIGRPAAAASSNALGIASTREGSTKEKRRGEGKQVQQHCPGISRAPRFPGFCIALGAQAGMSQSRQFQDLRAGICGGLRRTLRAAGQFLFPAPISLRLQDADLPK